MPAVKVGDEWRVVDWPLPYIKADRIVTRATYSRRPKDNIIKRCTPHPSSAASILSGRQGLVTNVQRASDEPSFERCLPELRAFFEEVAESRGMGGGADMTATFSELCAEYTGSKVDALNALLRGDLPIDGQRRAVGIEGVDDATRRFEGEANYLAVYAFGDEERALSMCEQTDTELRIHTEMVAAVRAKVVRHDWGSGRPMRLGVAEEGLHYSARKYTWWMENPPTAQRARASRRLNCRRAPTEGFNFDIPTAATLVGDGCLDTITVGTYVIRKGDRDRISREAQRAVLTLGVCGGVACDPESLSLSHRVGVTFSGENGRGEEGVQSILFSPSV